MVRKPLAVLAVAVAVVGAAGLWHATPVDATSHSAVRSFSAPWVLPGGRLEVTIAVSDYGGFGQVVETLPSGFSYEGSDLSEAAVAVEGQTVAFTLLGDERFTYTVAAPSAEGSHSFAGVLLDSHRVDQAVGGDSSIRVGPAPTPTPEPTPDAYADADPGADGYAHTGADSHAHTGADGYAHTGADATPTLEPTATPTPEPTATLTPEPTATLTPEPATAIPTPTVAPEPTPTRSRSAALPPPPASEPEEGPLIWLIALVGVGAVLAIVVVSTRFWRSESQS